MKMNRKQVGFIIACIVLFGAGITYQNCGQVSETASKQFNDPGKNATALRDGEGNREEFDCSNVAQTGVPESECQALVDLYNATGGENWVKHDDWNPSEIIPGNSNWLSDQPIYTWGGLWDVSVQDGHVIHLTLDNHHLVGTIPESIGNLTHLKTLNLSSNLDFGELTRNRLTGTIPESIGNLTMLEQLNLRVNKLTGSINNSTIENLTQLHTLLLDHNCLNDLDTTVTDFLASLNLVQFTFYPQNTASQCSVFPVHPNDGPNRPRPTTTGGTTVNPSVKNSPQYDKDGNRIVTRKLIKNEKMADAELEKLLQEQQVKMLKELQEKMTKEAEAKK